MVWVDEFDAADVPEERQDALVDLLLVTHLEAVVSSPDWWRRFADSYGVGRKTVIDTFEAFAPKALDALKARTRGKTNPPKQVREFVALAGIDTTEENLYRLVFQPELRLLPPMVLAAMCVDPEVTITRLELRVVARGQPDARTEHRMVHSTGEDNLGARRNALVAFASGEIAGKPCHLPIAAARIDSQICAGDPQEALYKAAEELLDVLERAAERLTRVGFRQCAKALRSLPMLVAPLVFGKPLGRGRRALLAYELLPATSFRLAALIHDFGRRSMLALTGRPRTASKTARPQLCASDRVAIGVRGQAIDADEAHRYSAALLEKGVTSRQGRKLIATLGLEVVDVRGPDHEAWLLPVATAEGHRRPNAVLTPAKPRTAGEIPRLTYGTALRLDLEARAAQWWLIQDLAGFKALTGAMRPEQLARAFSCERRYRERVSVLMHLTLSAADEFMIGAEAAMLAVNLVYVRLGLAPTPGSPA